MKILNPQKQSNPKGNLTKYLPPSILNQSKPYKNRTDNSNIHCRSMQQLDFNANIASNTLISKEIIKPNVHHSSLFNQNKTIRGDQQTGTSKSLSKFISFFQNSNILKTNQPKRETNDIKRKNYNGFCYDLKIGTNLPVNNRQNLRKKQKQNINYQTLNSQRQSNLLNCNRSPRIEKNQKNTIACNNTNQNQQILICKMKDVIEQQKKREIKYCQIIQMLEVKNKEIVKQISKYQNQIQIMNKKFQQSEERMRKLEIKNNQYLQINKRIISKQQKCNNRSTRQQHMIIKSLKKVISEQLDKIIDLQRFKIQNQYLREKFGFQEGKSFSEQSFSNHNYSFEFGNEKQSKKSFDSSISKQDLVENLEYDRQLFKKSKTNKDMQLEKQKANLKETHFKSFFQIEESPISSDGNLMSLFKPTQTKRSSGNNEQNINCRKIKQTNMIKINEAQSSFSRQAIQEVNEENCQQQKQHYRNNQSQQNSNQQCEFDIREQQDSILQEVDQYLSKWRNQA